MALTDFDQTIKSYIENKLREEFPELSIAAGDPLSDLFINPLISLFRPFIEMVNRTDLVQDLSNSSSMTTEELDKIGTNNYGLPRNAGTRASGYVFVEMNPEYVTDVVVIGPLVVENTNGLRYTNTVSTIIRYRETDKAPIGGTIVSGIAADYLNPSTGKYEFPVYVEAEEDGTSYNVDVGEINKLISNYPLLTGVVTNKDAFVNGSDEESNDEYAERLRNSFGAKQLGTKNGYRKYLIDNFDSVRDVSVVGYGDSRMERDKVIVRENGITTEKSIGGKVDLYVKGSSYETYDQVIYINSDVIRLDYPLLTDETFVTVNNITNPENGDLQAQIIYEFPETKTGWTEVKVISGPSNNLPAIGDEIQVKYQAYVDEQMDEAIWVTQTLYYKSNIVRISKTPVSDISSIYNDTLDIDIPIDGTYVLERINPIIERGICPDQTGLNLNQIKLNPLEAVYIDDYYVGMTLYVSSGPGAGQSKVITAYDKITQVCTLDSDFTTVPTSSSSYFIRDKKNSLQKSPKDTINLTLDTALQVGDPPANAFNEGDKVIVSYTYNKLLNDIQFDIDIKENRVITTDVLVKEAKPIYIYLGFYVKCLRGKTITSVEELTISAAIEEILQAVNFNSDIQLTDIISQLYKNSSIMSFMDYIVMPAIFFSSEIQQTYTKDELLALTDSQYKQSIIKFTNDDYPVLGMLSVKAAE